MKTAHTSPDRLLGVALVVTIAHVLVLAGLGVYWPDSGESVLGAPSGARHWTSPGEFMSSGEVVSGSVSQLDLPLSTLSGTPPSKGTPATRLEIRVVKSTPDPESSSSSGSAPAGDASGIDMSEIDAAIVAAFRNHWVLPSKLGEDHRNLNVVMDVSIERDGQVNGALLVKSSGTAEIDVSALKAAERIKNIGVRLPPEFLGDRYEVRMHFHAE